MGTHTASLLTTVSDLAGFRSWTNGMIQALLSSGATLGPGINTDWTTAPLPTTPGQMVGTTRFVFTDALQETHPVGIQIQLGMGGTTTRCGFATWVGRGVTPTGGIPSARYIDRHDSHVSLTTGLDCRFSCAPNRFSLAMWLNNTSARATLFSVERTKDANGNDTNEGILVFAMGSMGNSQVYKWALTYDFATDLWFPGATNYRTSQSISAMPPTAVSTGIQDGQTCIYPAYAHKAGRLMNPSTCQFFYLLNDFVPLVPITAFHAGRNYTLLPLPGTANSVLNTNMPVSNDLRHMIRWE